MKRKLLFVAPLLLAACSGGSLNVDINSDDAAENTTASRVSALETVDLTTVKSVNVTVSEIWAHVEDAKEAQDQVDGSKVEDSDKKWVQVSSEEKTFDLMTVRNDATKPLGDLAVPEGKITQLRLKLKGTAAEGTDNYRIAGAVVETNGTVCDLVVPKSAINPGVKIEGTFKAMQIEAGGKHHAIITLRLKDSEKLADGGATCAYRLNPVMKVKKFETETSDDKGDDTKN
ncbi:MAG: DUF4382 domain-containing protein [Archangium sp.]